MVTLGMIAITVALCGDRLMRYKNGEDHETNCLANGRRFLTDTDEEEED